MCCSLTEACDSRAVNVSVNARKKTKSADLNFTTFSKTYWQIRKFILCQYDDKLRLYFVYLNCVNFRTKNAPSWAIFSYRQLRFIPLKIIKNWIYRILQNETKKRFRLSLIISIIGDVAFSIIIRIYHYLLSIYIWSFRTTTFEKLFRES